MTKKWYDYDKITKYCESVGVGFNATFTPLNMEFKMEYKGLSRTIDVPKDLPNEICTYYIMNEIDKFVKHCEKPRSCTTCAARGCQWYCDSKCQFMSGWTDVRPELPKPDPVDILPKQLNKPAELTMRVEVNKDILAKLTGIPAYNPAKLNPSLFYEQFKNIMEDELATPNDFRREVLGERCGSFDRLGGGIMDILSPKYMQEFGEKCHKAGVVCSMKVDYLYPRYVVLFEHERTRLLKRCAIDIGASQPILNQWLMTELDEFVREVRELSGQYPNRYSAREQEAIRQVNGVRGQSGRYPRKHDDTPAAVGYMAYSAKYKKGSLFGMNIKDQIKKVIFNDPATVILWKDGTKTMVKVQEGDFYDPEKGMAMCICKRVLGDKGNFNDIFKQYLPDEEECDKMISGSIAKAVLEAIAEVGNVQCATVDEIKEEYTGMKMKEAGEALAEGLAEGVQAGLEEFKPDVETAFAGTEQIGKFETVNMTLREFAVMKDIPLGPLRDAVRRGDYPEAFKEKGKWYIPVKRLIEED